MTLKNSIGVIAALAVLSLGGCGTVSKVGSLNPIHGKSKGKHAVVHTNRIPVVALNEQLKVADALKGQDFLLPDPTPVTDWSLPSGPPGQTVDHAAAAADFAVAWRHSIGAGSSRSKHVLAPPIAAGGRVYVMDGGAEVSAHDAQTGAQIWRVNIMPKAKRDREGWGGGLAFSDGKVYASSGFREVVQLDAASGAIGWRTRTDAPVHAAPTVAGGRVFVADVNDELLAFDAATGVQAWTYQALTEPARILAASSPVVDNETLVSTFASGELVALRAANGTELWNASLSKASRTNALSEIRDIAGRPVVYKSDVFAVSHSDVFSAVDLRTGIPRWTLPISAITTPWPAGDVVYVVDLSGQVICVSRDSGQVYWIRDLNDGLKKKQRAYWSSPILASNRLITLSSHGEAIALNPKTGATLKAIKLGPSALIGPIAFGNMVYAVTDNAELVAIR